MTSRTADFNTLPVADLQNGALVLIALLMVIGACPVSTGGGIKTMTFAVLLLGLRALAANRETIEYRGREIPHKTVLSALNVFILTFLPPQADCWPYRSSSPGFPCTISRSRPSPRSARSGSAPASPHS